MSVEPARPTDPAPARPLAPPARRAAGELRQAATLAFAVFMSGGVLLALEIAASRVLAPYFGNSLFVWGALIGVVLTGLAIGYWAGGALADRLPAAGLLLGAMSLGAGLVLLVPLVDGPVLEAILDWDPGPRANPLVAAAALFGPVSIVLAGVTPIAVRLAARSLATVGRTAGRLFALSTAGSIAGTFATAFFLLPEYGTEQLLAGAAAVLFAAVALVGAASSGTALRVAAAVAVLAAVGAGFVSSDLAPESSGRLAGAAAENWSPLYRQRGGVRGGVDHAAEGYRVRFRRDTRYHALAVVEDEDSRYLRFDNSFQSGMYLDRPFVARFAYTDYLALLGPLYAPAARDVLFVGLGGGSAPKLLWREFPALRLHAVELDPVVVDVARRWFRLPDDPRLGVDAEDGRRYLTRSERDWDVIALDAFYSDAVPFHLTTLEFAELARERLAPGGVLVANVVGALRGPSSKLFRSLIRTYRAVFPTVLVHPVYEPGETTQTDLRNIIVVATERPATERAFLLRRLRELRAERPRVPDLARAVRQRDDRVVPTGDVPVLTDDYAPTDSLLLVD